MYVVASLYFEHAADGFLCKKIIGMYVCQGNTHTQCLCNNFISMLVMNILQRIM